MTQPAEWLYVNRRPSHSMLSGGYRGHAPRGHTDTVMMTMARRQTIEILKLFWYSRNISC